MIESIPARFAKALATERRPEVVFELGYALAAYLDVTRDVEGARDIRRTADTLRPIFGGVRADLEWGEYRAAQPFLKRLFLPRYPSREYREEYTARYRALGRQTALKLLNQKETV